MSFESGTIQQLRTFSLGQLRPKPGPIHTIALDSDGSIYCSDELNNSVFSLDSQGKLRWMAVGKGAKSSLFHYPRGVALGWIARNGIPDRCLGVADSWNHRVLFLCLSDGSIMGSLEANLDGPLAEPTDLRFVTSDTSSSYWLVLDKGKNQLSAYDIEQRPFGCWGKSINSSIAAKWAASGSYPDFEALGGSARARYDLLYHAERILGEGPNGLFFWEPLKRSLKVIAYSNFVPLSVANFPQEIIAADENGIVGWARTDNSISFFDWSGHVFPVDQVRGKPICSNLPSVEICLQDDDSIRHIRIILPAFPDTTTRKSGSFVQRLLLNSAEKDLASLDCSTVVKGIQPFHHICDELISLADSTIAALEQKEKAHKEIELLTDRANALLQEWNEARNVFNSNLRTFGLGILMVRLALCGGSESSNNTPASVPPFWEIVTKETVSRLHALVQRADDLTILTINRSDGNATERPFSRLHEAASTTSRALSSIINWILQWQNRTCRSAMPLAADFAESNLDVLSKPAASQNNRIVLGKAHSGRSLSLRELPYFDCKKEKEDPGGHLYLAMSRAGCLFVSRQAANMIVELNARGEITTVIGSKGNNSISFKEPTGLALDDSDRLYISDSRNHRIVVFSPPYEKSNSVQILKPTAFEAADLHGLLIFRKSLLVADPGCNSLIRIEDNQIAKTLLSKRGSALDSLRFPHSLCLDALSPEKYFWLVDRRNHRILKIDNSGTVVKPLGSFGLETGRFFYPLAIAMFSDGAIVVSESMKLPALVFITQEGEEIDRLHLDYIPSGMIIQNDVLYVGEYNQDRIRRYLRIS